MITERKLICGTKEELIEYHLNLKNRYLQFNEKYSIESQLDAILKRPNAIGSVFYHSENPKEPLILDLISYGVCIIPPEQTKSSSNTPIPDVVEEQRLSMQVAFGKPKTENVKIYKKIYNPTEPPFKHHTEHTGAIYELLEEWCLHFSKTFTKRPQFAKLTTGLEIWSYLKNHSKYSDSDKSLRLFDLTLEMIPDWTVYKHQIELTLE